MSKDKKKVAAIVLAAGASTRMGQPKLGLPWGKSTIIGQVIQVLSQADLEEILVVVGKSKEIVASVLKDYQVEIVVNTGSAKGEMLSSAQVGLNSLSLDIDATLIVLGDQPFIQFDVVEKIVSRYRNLGCNLIVPSYRMQRGHPWLVDRSLWGGILQLDERQTLRDFLNANQALINYLEVETDSILIDLDTPSDYLRHRLKNSQ